MPRILLVIFYVATLSPMRVTMLPSSMYCQLSGLGQISLQHCCYLVFFWLNYGSEFPALLQRHWLDVGKHAHPVISSAAKIPVPKSELLAERSRLTGVTVEKLVDERKISCLKLKACKVCCLMEGAELLQFATTED